MRKEGESGDVLYELLANTVANRLVQKGVAENDAKEIGAECTAEVKQRWGGGHVYLPKDDAGKWAKRNGEIWDAFDGTNYRELARKHSLTEMRIRQIVAAARRQRRGGA